jgi:hypothetical protein
MLFEKCARDIMSDNISTNSVFHFTRSLDNVESILRNDFYPKFCIEDIVGTITGIPGVEKAIPMVCFCDIPLSQIKKHVKTYGEYAIGLSKEWAIKQKVNPVLYTYQNSDMANKLANAFHALFEYERNNNLKENKMSDNFMAAIQYVKPYEGALWRDGQWSKEIIRFYDEREWRYVPIVKDKNGPSMIRKSEESDFSAAIARLNNDLVKSGFWRLSFQPNDIKYIIVRHEDEVLDMLDKVIHIKRDKFSYKDVQLLTTRIISMDNIKENF